jgi:signal transduction histidine kinase
MTRLRIKLALFNLLSKLLFTGLFLIFMPFLVERITLLQEDNNLIQKREQVLSLISKIGIEPFITSDSAKVFGNYNIFKEEFMSLERDNSKQEVNDIEISTRLIEGDEITYRVLNYSFKVDGKMYLLEVGKSLSSIDRAEKNIKKIIWLFVISIIIITFLIDLYYTGLLLRPLNKITKKLKGISDPSIFDSRQVKTTTSDFIHLDNALIELMAHINDLFKKEKEITVNISHELLTPVSVIRSNLENLLLEKDLDPSVVERIGESLKMLNRLQSLVNSLLLIARIESRQYLREESFSLNDLLTEIIGELAPIADDAGIVLKYNFEKDFNIVRANRSLTFSMFYNVVNNALKNTPSGGNVTIKSFFNRNNFIVSISDTGKGMSPDQLSTLFFRFKSRIVPEADGTGIGLAIAKSIADFHRIEILVDSTVSKGTCFSFRFSENS